MNLRRHLTEDDTLEARLGGAIVARLNQQAAGLPHDVSERLRAGREQALARARLKPALAARPVQAVAPLLAGRASHAALLVAGAPSWRVKLASGLPLLVLIAGLVLIEHWNTQQQVHAAAEIDAMLLADDLPPAAYADPGFGEFLRSAKPEQP